MEHDMETGVYRGTQGYSPSRTPVSMISGFIGATCEKDEYMQVTLHTSFTVVSTTSVGLYYRDNL